MGRTLLDIAAGFFNDLKAEDAYTGEEFICQFDPLSFAKIEGVALMKRQISVTPDVAPPPRGAVRIGGAVYLTGFPAPDFFNGKVVRKTLVIQGVDGLAELNSIGGVLDDVAGVSAYAALIFNRYLPDQVDSSKYPPQYQVFTAGVESAPANSIVKLNGVWYLVKESYLSQSGLRVALANVLEEPVTGVARYTSTTYDPVTGEDTGTVSDQPYLRVKWHEHFQYLTEGSTDFKRGDMQVFVLKNITPKPSDIFEFSGVNWEVLSVQEEDDTWCCHVRRD